MTPGDGRASLREAIPLAWRDRLEQSVDGLVFTGLEGFLRQRHEAQARIYPSDPFAALRAVRPESVRVVILGQDPYHGDGQANGLAFSVADGQRVPPSLRNIFAELERDAESGGRPAGGDLSGWAAQGVLLLNAVLTVEDGNPGSHRQRGWEQVTDAIVSIVAVDPAPKAFLLWGAQAQAKAALVRAAGPHNRIWESNHPSPLSARRGPKPFIGCGHFSDVNRFLRSQGEAAIRWSASGGGALRA